MARTVAALRQHEQARQTQRSSRPRQVRAVGDSNRVKKNYRKGRKFNKWTETAMENALKEYRATLDHSPNKMRTIAHAWGIPKSTLQRRLVGKVSGHGHESGRKPVMSTHAKDELSDVIKMLAARGFPLGAVEVRQLAAQYSAANGKNIFKKKLAGYYWFQGFMLRHPELRIKKPEALSSIHTSKWNE